MSNPHGIYLLPANSMGDEPMLWVGQRRFGIDPLTAAEWIRVLSNYVYMDMKNAGEISEGPTEKKATLEAAETALRQAG